jgi:hypothetical protein
MTALVVISFVWHERKKSAFFRKTKKPVNVSLQAFIMSGWQDSNLRPPRPKRGAMTGLRYTPNGVLNSNSKELPSKTEDKDNPFFLFSKKN